MILPRGAARGLLGVFLLLSTACRDSGPPADAGSVKDGVYRNKYFNMTLPLSEGWLHEKPPFKLGKLLGTYLGFIAAGDTLMKEGDDPEDRVRRMFRLSSARIDLVGYEDAMLMGGAAELGYQPKVRRGADLLPGAEILLRARKTEFTILGRRRIRLGGVDFDVLDFEVILADGKLRESVYVTLRWGHALAFTVVSRSTRGQQAGERALKNVSFENGLSPGPDPAHPKSVRNFGLDEPEISRTASLRSSTGTFHSRLRVHWT